MPPATALIAAYMNSFLDAATLGLHHAVPGGAPVAAVTVGIGGILYMRKRRRDDYEVLPNVSEAIAGPLSRLVEKADANLIKAVAAKRRFEEEEARIDNDYQVQKAKRAKLRNTLEENVKNFEKQKEDFEKQKDELVACSNRLSKSHAVTVKKEGDSVTPASDGTTDKRTVPKKCKRKAS
jgi:hypothetical protein